MPSYSAYRQRLYLLAFEPVRVHSGTPYPCRHDDLASYHRYPGPNRQRKVHAGQATQEIVRRNAETRQRQDFGPAEWSAMKRITRGVNQCEENGWGPDIIIKMFADLDIIFFSGALIGNVTLSWDLLPPGCLGLTKSTGGNQCDITLNPEAIILSDGMSQSPFRQMFSTMLHEMCHAYGFVRCPISERCRGDGHDSHFRTMIHAIHRRAYDNLGLAVIDRNEEYFHYHHMSDQWAHEEGGGLYGPRDDGPILGSEHFRGDGTEVRSYSRARGRYGGGIPGGTSYGGSSGSFGGSSLGGVGPSNIDSMMLGGW